jgi:hypothetical protein
MNINFTAQFANPYTGVVAPNLTINTEVGILDMINNLETPLTQ